MSKCIVIASGGTGGHLYPTIAVAEEIRSERPDIRIAFIGTSDRIEAREVPRAGFEFFPIDIQAPGKSAVSLLRFPLKYLAASRRSRAILRELTPSAFLGGGAYLSVPSAFAARSAGIPVALLEINAVPGRANTVLAGIAGKIFLAYPEAALGFKASHRHKIETIGTPVRTSLAATKSSVQDARSHFGLYRDRKTLLVVGGSLGARSINEMMTRYAGSFLEHGYNIIWQTGKSANTGEMQEKFSDSSSIAIMEYINEMEKAYAASDLVISRAGASTLAELAAVGKPAILVPYPLAAKSHQEHNARAFEQAGAAVVIADSALGVSLEPAVLRLMQDDAARRRMSEKMQTRENKDARKVVAQWLIARIAT